MMKNPSKVFLEERDSFTVYLIALGMRHMHALAISICRNNYFKFTIKLFIIATNQTVEI